MSSRYTADELRELPTLATGQADDLKIDRDGTRIWLARVGVADGMPYNDQVTVERFNGNRWITVEEYPG